MGGYTRTQLQQALDDLVAKGLVEFGADGRYRATKRVLDVLPKSFEAPITAIEFKQPND